MSSSTSSRLSAASKTLIGKLSKGLWTTCANFFGKVCPVTVVTFLVFDCDELVCVVVIYVVIPSDETVFVVDVFVRGVALGGIIPLAALQKKLELNWLYTVFVY